MLYYRLDAGGAAIQTIDADEFRAAVGDRPPDATTDFSAMKESVRGEYLWRLLTNQSVSGLPVSVVSVWRLDEDTGKAEGWVIAARKNGKRVSDDPEPL